MSIFVGNLPFRAEREDVLELFAPFGEVLNCSLPLERDTGRKRGKLLGEKIVDLNMHYFSTTRVCFEVE